jgi:two-component system response regulator YesN
MRPQRSEAVMALSLQQRKVVERLAATIRAHYAEPFTLLRAAADVGRHPNYVGLMFKQQMGVSVRTYLIHYRLERAADSILNGDKIEAVSLAVGYRSKKNFYRQFKRYFGVTPEQYRHLRRDSARAVVGERRRL